MKNEMKVAILESPYAGDIRLNRFFAENVARQLLFKGWNCMASHLYYPHFLDEHDPAERQLGIDAGLMWGDLVKDVFFVLPERVAAPSRGMLYSQARHVEAGRTIHCFICDNDGNIRHSLEPSQFFHPDGWREGMKQAIRDTVRARQEYYAEDS